MISNKLIEVVVKFFMSLGKPRSQLNPIGFEIARNSHYNEFNDWMYSAFRNPMMPQRFPCQSTLGRMFNRTYVEWSYLREPFRPLKNFIQTLFTGRIKRRGVFKTIRLGESFIDEFVRENYYHIEEPWKGIDYFYPVTLRNEFLMMAYKTCDWLFQNVSRPIGVWYRHGYNFISTLENHGRQRIIPLIETINDNQIPSAPLFKSIEEARTFGQTATAEQINGLKKKMKKCRCYINASYRERTAFRTGRLPQPCPIHDTDIDEIVFNQAAIDAAKEKQPHGN